MTAYVSAFDLFSIGIGPSSSHTVGPMRAALLFGSRLTDAGLLGAVDRVTCVLFGSLGSTGIGHGTPDAIVAGLRGLRPETCEPAEVREAWSRLEPGSTLLLAGTRSILFEKADITFEPRTRLPGHPNALTLAAWSGTSDVPLVTETYYSVGGGFIRRDGEDPAGRPSVEYPLPFPTATKLLDICASQGLRIDEVARRNEEAARSPEEVDSGLDTIWAAMTESVTNGLATSGVLPGGLRVKRRAAAVREHLEIAEAESGRELPTEWLHSFALAVNEENAAGGRVVTAPTNGAAGILPAVASYYLRFVPGASADGIRRFLLTATAIGSLFKANASISGAVGGCQAEVGSACAMAAGALCGVLGGSPAQVENAAEIAMEHHLGLTCDPVGGLVQVPCIERNAIASSTAVSAARLALHGDGSHLVSLDAVIETMRQTGVDMSSKYKETSEGGLAVNVIEC
ncbi:L-serine ammonia-lyase [Mycetocola zhadangensis]|uniref:L-serine dehydratase n=1 Tax=Mycetocola zhadangensis TaxID=1164595 RepID=A0A3L7J4S5_9MICO|nr:L-serine ammonia-lyase [Mycetocola zhadangensis]RLQ85593.1 L-serine ammonia-lyase [Mycetocola zhadangensis]GGE83964.1 L-serine dehydratase [Mycetocola zhadangensis]